jgi:ATP-dependent DNA ligase
VLDGEIVVLDQERISFEWLLQRIHPAESRVRLLSRQYPALYVVFDLLVDDRGRDLTGLTLAERRQRLERFVERVVRRGVRIRLSPATTDVAVARSWFTTPSVGLDGVMAKPLDEPYRSDERAMLKLKRIRTADCVVGGFRYASRGPVIGSLLLGLYDDEGLLHHVGFTSTIRATERERLTRRLERLIEPPGFTGKAPGGPSRWSTRRSTEWQPLRPELVVEVAYDHVSGGRFRHGTRLVRWRPDKDARQCKYAQIEPPAVNSLHPI